MICTMYAHYTGFDRIKQIVEEIFPEGKLAITKDGESDMLECEIKGGLLKPASRLRIQYRQKEIPSYTIMDDDQSAFTNNLRGLYGYARSLPFSDEDLKARFLKKILTLNCEFSIAVVKGEIKELKKMLQQLAQAFDAILFAQPKTVISQSKGQHFLNKDLELIIDQEGNSETTTLAVEIESVYFDQQIPPTEEQQARKSRSEKILESWNVKVNRHLPVIQSEDEVNIRQPSAIAKRVAVLAVTNLVAFNGIPAAEAVHYLQQSNLWEMVTPAERDFLADPTEEKKSIETWKCECIYTLLWALHKTESLPSPAELCNLGDIPPDQYPVGKDKSPDEFIKAATTLRSKAAILDAADLYYRLDWACVDARINGKEMTQAHPGVVYERHYALNWLISYGNQEWDDVRCDT
jgi:hypothetical protein